jgi:hypothetical protein
MAYLDYSIGLVFYPVVFFEMGVIINKVRNGSNIGTDSEWWSKRQFTVNGYIFLPNTFQLLLFIFSPQHTHTHTHITKKTNVSLW